MRSYPPMRIWIQAGRGSSDAALFCRSVASASEILHDACKEVNQLQYLEQQSNDSKYGVHKPAFHLICGLAPLLSLLSSRNESSSMSLMLQHTGIELSLQFCALLQHTKACATYRMYVSPDCGYHPHQMMSTTIYCTRH